MNRDHAYLTQSPIVEKPIAGDSKHMSSSPHGLPVVFPVLDRDPVCTIIDDDDDERTKANDAKADIRVARVYDCGDIIA